MSDFISFMHGQLVHTCAIRLPSVEFRNELPSYSWVCLRFVFLPVANPEMNKTFLRNNDRKVPPLPRKKFRVRIALLAFDPFDVDRDDKEGFSVSQ